MMKARAANEISMTLHELDKLGVAAKSFEADIERAVLFQQLRTQLSDRDRFILILLTELDAGPKNVAHALGISTEAATKAIQRVRQRLAGCLDTAANFPKEKRMRYPFRKGLTREWI
ncbi:hypothetical protein [Acidobacterium sp. S8]|uniref:hypothetical protein n=1 Tax=Acidobacterium sp. S8 TaxID=1641854 RepID=UPI001C203B2F|nr:hypothetical protein [Acidobacterium sp. S8]